MEIRIAYTDKDVCFEDIKTADSILLKNDGEISDDDLVGDNEGTLAVYVKDKKWHFVGINSAGKIIKGFEVPDKKLFKMKLSTDDDGNKIAIDQDEKIYKVIRPKKKK